MAKKLYLSYHPPFGFAALTSSDFSTAVVSRTSTMAVLATTAPATEAEEQDRHTHRNSRTFGRNNQQK